ncbi:2-succinyl-5-enolpyruvyl-6-hydroxy-3-cyclohexene-1-carboxylic-acid synthase [Cryobacterium tepidiphilum]|uniref:2-succinyl-5-enolpyruvyl-6-hydroxy-3-cyclohexene-1-carboxylate synthase n=1 Tax=Cryobacterium tepidiphilum TaxID=2486026 RepID=A0A3M8L9X5_9MICO|nr:2-succinyl-5-enolpyruvyl-6-hydroxy-3-cyclohexene-1-carboxylic-acid synthase [Cryobacterium tepidiphilum]RNE62105.1 2-succinyl-5-enolpyruvyl-6-hydroxy-3-cyclohexene-1-carboxylic-acid synthase [Cryobacterium tepidiphilum]
MPEGPTGSPATDFSVALLRAFVRHGVRHLVLSPGSRSQALALVAAELERLGELQLHVRVDERGAGFLALGLAVESGAPTLVATTSGTAVANLHPAVLEAHHSGVPLVLLTADRPEELRGIRSNQTTAQPGIFGAATRLSVDVPAPSDDDDAASAVSLAGLAMQAATGAADRDPGPVQLNLAFREPLSAHVRLEPAAAAPAETPAVDLPEDGVLSSLTLEPGPRTVVVAGAGAGEDAEELARAAGWPLLAEVTSGARFGPNLIAGYRELLQEPDWGGRIERVVVFGHPTLSREVPALIQRADVETIVVSPAGLEWYNPGHAAQQFARAVSASPASVAEAGSREAREWLGRWVVAGRQLRDALDASEQPPDVEAARSKDYRVRGGFAKAELAALRTPVTRGMLVDQVWRASWPHDRLVFGASRLIREADRRVPGKKMRVHANRGLAGIDGTVATALGIALASQGGDDPASTGVTRLLLGDLALLHDAGSLLLPAGEERPRLQVIVGNDGGGTIFDSLEVAGTAPAAAMDRVLFTPQAVDLAALAAAYGWEYTRAATRSELERALTAPHPGLSIVEVPLARD